MTSTRHAGGFAATYAYDIEDRLGSATISGTTSSYAYDSLNRRVFSGSSSGQLIYFYSPDGKKLGVWSLNASTFQNVSVNQWFGGRLLKNEDRLQSVGKYFPYGEDRYSPNPANPANDQEKFATYTRDSATGLDYAMNRYYSTVIGRFMTTDTAQANESRPQSWNRYVYAMSDPVTAYDPLGLSPGDPGTVTFCWDEDGGEYIGTYVTCFGGGNASQIQPSTGNPVANATNFRAAKAALQRAAKDLAKKKFGNNCEKDLQAVHVTDNQIHSAAESAVFLNGVGNQTPMSSLYATSPVPGVRQAGASIPGTVGTFIATHTGTVAVAQLGGPDMYLNGSLIDPADYFTDSATLFHELLHNTTGLTDNDLQRALGLSESNISNNITLKLLKDCF